MYDFLLRLSAVWISDEEKNLKFLEISNLWTRKTKVHPAIHQYGKKLSKRSWMREINNERKALIKPTINPTPVSSVRNKMAN